jgi:hypothetical protein
MAGSPATAACGEGGAAISATLPVPAGSRTTLLATPTSDASDSRTRWLAAPTGRSSSTPAFRASGRPALRERDRGVLVSCFQPRAMRSEGASLLKGWRAAAVVLSCTGYARCTRGHVRGWSNRTSGTGWPCRYHNPLRIAANDRHLVRDTYQKKSCKSALSHGFHCRLKIVVSSVRFRVSSFDNGQEWAVAPDDVPAWPRRSRRATRATRDARGSSEAATRPAAVLGRAHAGEAAFSLQAHRGPGARLAARSVPRAGLRPEVLSAMCGR